jgi:hypothetical protein
LPDDITAACAEFPNDNPALHRGAIWRCADPCEPASVEAPVGPFGAVAVREPVSPRLVAAFDADEGEFGGDIEIVDELVFDGDFVQEGAVLVALPGAPAHSDDPFVVWMQRVEDAVRSAGGGADLVRGLSWLVGEGPPGSCTLPDASARALAEGDLVERGSDGLARSERLTRAVDAWKGILRGESEDFSACGGSSLDEWTSDVAARLLGAPARAAGLRRDLRARGVAAFGLLDEVG